jgi:hypothetical protein
LPRIDPDARRRRLTAAVNTATLARDSPAVYVVEDAHWIDEVSESMIADFLTVIPQTPSLVLATYRPEYEGALARVHGAQTIVLAPLRVASPIRTGNSSDRCASTAASTADFGEANAAHTPSPVCLNNQPPCASIAARNTSSWAASAARMPSASFSHRRVEPSTSVNKNVTTPEGAAAGSSGHAHRISHATRSYLAHRRIRPGHRVTSVFETKFRHHADVATDACSSRARLPFASSTRIVVMCKMIEKGTR